MKKNKLDKKSIRPYMILGSLFILAGILTACSGMKKDQTVITELSDDVTGSIQYVTVTRGDLEVSVYLDAQVGPRIEQLSFPEEGSFGQYLVELGDTVKKGDLLAKADTRTARKKLREKEKELENLEADHTWQKASYENQIEILKLRMQDVYDQIEKAEYLTPEFTALCIKAGEYDEDKKRLELQLSQLEESFSLDQQYLQEQVDLQKKKIQENVIRAPFDGVIVALYDQAGEKTITKNQYYVAVADPKILYARCDYLGKSVLNTVKESIFWKDGEEYEAACIPMTDKKYLDMKNSKEPMYSEFEITNATDAVESGDYGKIKLIMSRKEQVLMLPKTALHTDESGNYVYRDKEGKKERTAVITGSKNTLYAEIVSGLQEGDRIYVDD